MKHLHNSVMNSARSRTGNVMTLRASFATIFLALLVSACSKGPTNEGDKAQGAAASSKAAATLPVVRMVDTVRPQAIADADAISLSGVLAFRDETRVAFKTGGVVGKIAVREGDVVKAGDLLAALNVAEVEAGFSQAQALHDKALRDLKRGETLRAQEVISQEVLDNLRTAEVAARAGLKAAKFNRGTAEIRATEAMVVVKRVAEAGEVVGPGQPVLLLGSLKSGLVFRGGLNDSQRVRLAAGARGQLKLDAWPGETFDVTVSELGQAADARTGAYRVELRIEPRAGRTLLSGMVGRATLPVQTDLKSGWLLPLSAVVETIGNEVTVYRLTDADVVEQQRLPLLQLRRDAVVVGGDLSPGARYVSSGTSYLSDGDSVRVQSVQEQGQKP